MLAINTENKVRSNSQLLDDAIALRYAQMEQERNPGDKACCPRIAACPTHALGSGRAEEST